MSNDTTTQAAGNVPQASPSEEVTSGTIPAGSTPAQIPAGDPVDGVTAGTQPEPKAQEVPELPNPMTLTHEELENIERFHFTDKDQLAAFVSEILRRDDGVTVASLAKLFESIFLHYAARVQPFVAAGVQQEITARLNGANGPIQIVEFERGLAGNNMFLPLLNSLLHPGCAQWAATQARDIIKQDADVPEEEKNSPELQAHLIRISDPYVWSSFIKESLERALKLTTDAVTQIAAAKVAREAAKAKEGEANPTDVAPAGEPEAGESKPVTLDEAQELEAKHGVSVGSASVVPTPSEAVEVHDAPAAEETQAAPDNVVEFPSGN